jgi:hypothetical protein
MECCQPRTAPAARQLLRPWLSHCFRPPAGRARAMQRPDLPGLALAFAQKEPSDGHRWNDCSAAVAAMRCGVGQRLSPNAATAATASQRRAAGATASQIGSTTERREPRATARVPACARGPAQAPISVRSATPGRCGIGPYRPAHPIRGRRSAAAALFPGSRGRPRCAGSCTGRPHRARNRRT